MIARTDVRKLLDREPVPGSPVLSVYLDVEQSRAANLNRGFETALENMLRSIERRIEDRRQKEHFEADAARVRRFISRYVPRGLGLVMFCDDSEGYFWSRDVRARLRNDAHWTATPHVRPLLEALDEFERYGVVLADRAHSRLFTVFMGEIEEHVEAFASLGVHHTKTTGTDHLWSQSHFQRKADTHARGHLKRVAELMADFWEAHHFDRLVLAGSPEATAELRRLLPKRLQSRVVATLHLNVDAAGSQVLEETQKAQIQVERREEARLLEDLITIAAKNDRAVIGLEATLRAVREGRVWRLVYLDALVLRGRRCPACSALYAENETACAFCGGPLGPVEDLVEAMAERAAEEGARVELVRGEAAERLRSVGGVGAYLRY